MRSLLSSPRACLRSGWGYPSDEEEPPLRLSAVSFGSCRFSFKLTVLNCTLQCHDLPGPQPSSPLSLMESNTGRSMDPLLPVGEPGRKRAPDAEPDVVQKYHSDRQRSHVRVTSTVLCLPYVWSSASHCFLFQEWYEERDREPRLTLRPPSLAAPYTPVQNWHHQPEKLIFESCAYEASVR